MSQRVPVLILVDDGYFGHETLQQELGPAFDVRLESGLRQTFGAMSEMHWPIVLAPRNLEPMEGDLVLADLARHRFDFVGALLLDDEELDRIGDGVHLIVRRPLRPGMLRLHIEAAVAMRTRCMAERETAARLSRDLGHLRDGLRHELRGQLQSVVGLASLVTELERPKRPPDDEVLDFIDRIANAGDRLTRFVDALSDWLNAARRPLERATVDLTELCAEVIAKVRASQSQALVLTLSGPEGAAVHVSADPRMLQKAVEILVLHALTQSTSVRLEIARVPSGWSLAVSDVCTRSLPSEQRHKAFELFERMAGGDGIGLALVHKVAERHGFTARIEALEAGGHEVVLELPWLEGRLGGMPEATGIVA